MQNPYITLGISPSADYPTARKRYISLAKKYHPDNFASSRKVSEDKMKQINNAFQLIKEEVLHDIVHFYYKGKFTKFEIDEIVKRYCKGQSLNKISRDMKRSRQAIRKHLIRLGYISDTYKNYSFVPEKNFCEYFMPSFNMVFLILFSLAMIIYSPQLCIFLCMFYYMGHDVFNDY